MKKEKIYNLLLFILIFVNILSIILLKPINNLDELWNYSFAKNIANGLIPYRDFNMVITPLLSFICGIILKITSNELIVMRCIAALLCSSILYVTYKLFNIMDVKKEISIIFTFLIGYLFKDLYCIDYNFASLLLVLIIIYKEIKFYKKDSKFMKIKLKEDLLLGLLAGLAIITKQTTGICISIVLLGNKLLFVRKKEYFKIYIKSFIYRLIGVIIPLILFIAYLLINNSFRDFINYAIKAISEFDNSKSYIKLIKWNILGTLSVLVPITFIYAWIKTIILEKDKLMYMLLVYGLAIFVICFPISDKMHFLIGALPTVILILYELYNLSYKLFKKIKFRILKNKKINMFILLSLKYMVILFLLYNCILNLYSYYNQQQSYSNLNHFRYISINNEIEERIKKVDEYIVTNENVKILDSSAIIYMIPIDKYNKDYDMFNKGNLGYNGEKRIIKEIANSKDTKYLILKDEFNKNWQTPLEIINYVKKNKIKTGEIEIFDIYE